MSRIFLMLALVACHSSTAVNVPPTTTGATVPAHQPPPSGKPVTPPPSPAPDPNSSQMPFTPR